MTIGTDLGDAADAALAMGKRLRELVTAFKAQYGPARPAPAYEVGQRFVSLGDCGWQAEVKGPPSWTYDRWEYPAVHCRLGATYDGHVTDSDQWLPILPKPEPPAGWELIGIVRVPVHGEEWVNQRGEVCSYERGDVPLMHVCDGRRWLIEAAWTWATTGDGSMARLVKCKPGKPDEVHVRLLDGTRASAIWAPDLASAWRRFDPASVAAKMNDEEPK